MLIKPNRKVDGFIKKAKQWQEEYERLRSILLSFEEMEEEIKWMHPCYTLDGKNIVLMHGFKDYCALLFHKGALLKDPQSILIQQTENVQSARQIRFTSAEEIIEMKPILEAYIQEAIEVEKAGLQVELKKTEEYTTPLELQQKFEEMPELKIAFEALTPGRQRAYILYISKAKQSKTRESRIEKYVQHILDGKGMNDE
ncbi:YdeI family protein [Rossellomorea sp. YZS02]|uniref:YdeI/OmpD-associated family protein n=1 Tax=Rossellomorea sp. YZS02 TaxID=3097358 RepID=UPI002A1802A1|nr:YdeI family protein [Rossellomorea sp. YZS02]MDX8342439.1 YdeI family protein [Rossellomorea sp. YZS02]